MAEPSFHCIHCAYPITTVQSYRIHRRWFTRIHNHCWWALMEWRIVRLRLAVDDPDLFAAEAQSIVTLSDRYSAAHLDSPMIAGEVPA